MAAGKKSRKSLIQGVQAQAVQAANQGGQGGQNGQANPSSQSSQTGPAPVLTAAGNGQPKLQATISTFYRLITNAYGNNIRYNVMTGKQEYWDRDEKVWAEWDDAMDAKARDYFERSYSLYSPTKLMDAMQIYFFDHQRNPLIDILKDLKWDGHSRIESFLHDVMKADDTPYVRECSRLIFAGGINRAYRPGCKFDEMVVLVGDQAAGKSTIIRWLNVDDQFFREVKTIQGKEGIEALRGVWIGEMAELMAMTRAKEVESVKAYITTQEDSYRPAYARHIVTIPRRSILIGSTNNAQFLSDRTGGRRFYPVLVKSSANDLFTHEDDVKEYIRQCWAEAIERYHNGNLPAFADPTIVNDIRKAQENAMEDDWRVGAIQEYLDTQKAPANSTVCVIELWHNALNEPDEHKPTRKDSIEIGQIMNRIDGWVRNGQPVRTGKWGLQKVWRKDNFAALWRK